MLNDYTAWTRGNLQQTVYIEVNMEWAISTGFSIDKSKAGD